MNSLAAVPHSIYRFAVGATFTAEPVEAAIRFWGGQLNANFEVRFAPYGQLVQALLDPAGEFVRNPHGANVALVRYEDLGQFDAWTPETLAQLEANALALASAVRESQASMSVPAIVVLCPSSPSFTADPARAASLARARVMFEARLDETPGVQFISDQELLRLYPVAHWYDAAGERMGRIPYTEEMFAALATAVVRRAFALSMPPYKAIAVDCDNTLWLGICGEDGPENVLLDPPRRALHEFLLAQRESGMLLCLSSKNNEQDVFDTFAAHPEFPLQLRHFASWRLNWHSKAEAIAEMAAELGIGLDSFIFLDDNAKECAEVSEAHPEALTLTLPENIEELPEILNHLWAFDHPVVTEEDRQRNVYYHQARDFGRELRQAANLEQFIASLNMRVDIAPLAPERVSRAAQLTQRTNQFNLTTIRRSESELLELVSAGSHEIYTAEVADRFGEYGLTGLLIVEKQPGECRADTFLLSCRVLGRGVEHRLLSFLGELAEESGARRIVVPFKETRKNAPAREFLESLGRGMRQNGTDGAVWIFNPQEIEALRWQPQISPPPAAPATRGAAPVQRGNVDFAHIARRLRTASAVHAAIRKQAQKPAAAAHAQGTETEQRLAVIWRELLQKPEVKPADNFFDLGGHSLLAVLLLMRIKEEFGVELSVDDVYSGSLTLAELAGTIEARRLGDISPEEYQALLAEIEGLSDEEVRALLEREGAGEGG
jgi:FkbH-like protein